MRSVPLLAALLALLIAPSAHAEADRTGTVSTATPAFAWDGALATGYNTAREPDACSHDVQTYCDQTLIKVDVPDGGVGELRVVTDGYFGPQCTPADGQNAPCDFSLWLYASDASGRAGRSLGSSVNDSGEPEELTYKKAVAGYYLVVVYYYTVAQSSYRGTATLAGVVTPTPAPAAGTVQSPAATSPALDLVAALAPAGRATAKRIGFSVTCSVACAGTLTARLSASQARKLRLPRTVARARFTAAGTVVLKPSRRVAARLARARGVRLQVQLAARAAGGRTVSAARTLTLR